MGASALAALLSQASSAKQGRDPSFAQHDTGRTQEKSPSTCERAALQSRAMTTPTVRALGAVTADDRFPN